MSEQLPSNPLVTKLRERAQVDCQNGNKNQTLCWRAADEIEKLELRVMTLERAAVEPKMTPNGAAGVRDLDPVALLKKASDLQQELDDLRAAQPPSVTAGGAVAHMDYLFRDDTTMSDVLKTEWIAAKKELIANRHGLTAEQVSVARESLLDAVAERVRAIQPPSVGWRPIATAPMDGRHAIVFRPLALESGDSPIDVKRLIGGNHHCWDCTVPEGQEPYNPTDGCCHVTHWMPFPEPPEGSPLTKGEAL